MPVQAYFAWERAGRPLTPCQPVLDIYNRFKAKYPRIKYPPSWYADDNHYKAVPAQDHTPYSQTGWPLESPQWYVFATDVMHEPAAGVNCEVLFGYWIGEARAGRMPWLKYIIWEAQLYDVRNGWRPQANSGHYDHIHLSVRTDHRTTGLDSWSLFPGETMPIEESSVSYQYLTWRLDAIANGKDVLAGTNIPPAVKGSPMWLVTRVKEINEKLDRVIATLAEFETPEPAPVDLAAVREIVRAELDKTRLGS